MFILLFSYTFIFKSYLIISKQELKCFVYLIKVYIDYINYSKFLTFMRF